ncbi:MAG: NAD-dependent epimerase/dehydratase family protein [Acidobacteria bacterium]|jgi:nucleoside-diphosphate-sugar epimerase|nr:NAD-dependent epimerase/dehydratase family protein [Acidobacteriota bacterium]
MPSFIPRSVTIFPIINDAVKLDRAVIAAFAEALAQTNKPFIVTSSSAILGDTGGREADEDFPFNQNSPRLLRGEAERDVLQLPQKGIRGVVLRLPLFVYGRGGSSFVPFMIEQAKKAGAANYIESGAEKVSAVHVEDVADLYVLGLETSTAKGLYNAAAETVSLKELNEAIARLLEIEAKSISREEARKQFGAMFDFLSINNQLSADKARRELGWKTKAATILDDIENGSYRNKK